MKLSFTLSTYRLKSFVHLGLAQLRKLSPESPILVCDDRAAESDAIKEYADQYGAQYRCSRVRRGHFAADFQSLVNAIVFAQSTGSDVAVKISQRFVFRKPESIDVIRKCFENPNIMAASPGQPKVTAGSAGARGFGAFGTLSDIVAIRTGALSPEQLLHLYRARLLREKVPWASFIECVVDELHNNVFPGRTIKIPELTNPTADPIYLRRYQATENQYRQLAHENGFNGLFPLTEWREIEKMGYMCKPKVI